MAPGSVVGINYQDQVINNCRFYLGTANLYIVTALSDDGMSHPHPWAAYVLKADFDKQTCVLSAAGNTRQEAITKLHDASARQVQSYIHANGFQIMRHDNKTGAKHDKIIVPEPPESSSDSDDEDNMSDASTASTHSLSSSAFGRPMTMPILTPPTPITMDSSSRIPCPSPARIVTHKCSVPLMNMNTNMNLNSLNNLNNHNLNSINMNPLPPPTQQKVVPVPPPPGWPARGNLAIPARPCHGNATNVPPPPPPPPPPAVRMAQPASASASASASAAGTTHMLPIPPPAAYPYSPANHGLMRPVIFTLRSSVYGELMALDKCALDYGLVLVRVCDILMERFQDFSNAPVVVPSRHKIRRMSLQIESVTVNGEKYVIGKNTRDLSALPLGPASKTVGVVVSVEKGDG